MAEKRIPKPQLRNLYVTSVKKHIIPAIICSMIGFFSFKYGLSKPKLDKIEHYMRTVDTDKLEARMAEAGLLQSYPETYKE